MASESYFIRPSASLAIDSEPIRARGIIAKDNLCLILTLINDLKVDLFLLNRNFYPLMLFTTGKLNCFHLKGIVVTVNERLGFRNF